MLEFHYWRYESIQCNAQQKPLCLESSSPRIRADKVIPTHACVRSVSTSPDDSPRRQVSALLALPRPTSTTQVLYVILPVLSPQCFWSPKSYSIRSAFHYHPLFFKCSCSLEFSWRCPPSHPCSSLFRLPCPSLLGYATQASCSCTVSC